MAMLSAALGNVGKTTQTQGSANLPIGIAWNMAGMAQTAKHWVLEMAIGNMSLNSQLAKPDVAIITNIAAAHLEYHHDLDTVALKKSRIFDAMQPNALAVVCRDIAQFELIAQAAQQKQLTLISYGEHPDADVRLLSYSQGLGKITAFGETLELRLNVLGKHFMLNALAIIAIAKKQGLDLAKILAALSAFRPVEGRGNQFTAEHAGKTITVINDAYNANPISMQAALLAFADHPAASTQKVLILGDMLELGADSEHYHRALAEHIHTHTARCVLLVGDASRATFDTLKARWANDSTTPTLAHFANRAELKSALADVLQQGDTVLIKASHGIGLEGVFQPLNAENSQPASQPASQNSVAAAILLANSPASKSTIKNGTLDITFAKRADEPKNPASLSKLLTAMLIWDKIHAHGINPAKHCLAFAHQLPQHRQYFTPNEQVSLLDLLSAMLILSCNDSAHLLARWHSGNEAAFVKQMNQLSQKLGMTHSHWTRSSGLEFKHARTTAYDLVILAEHFVQHYPTLSQLCAKPAFHRHGKNWASTNILLKEYPKLKGLKTGNLVGVGSNLILHWQQADRLHFAIILGAANSKERFEIGREVLEKS
ncbi:hypothetical protein B0181_07270 [Moraxella caviae]|uniref:D-alanyl-D-alanine carboxypeptidase n=1 Tax=Moraxella caviae TaxID=34060 RepID=A0A1T0A125_9GAMM|nr:hypothetical protein B0181_07270 [Moraxella caviae]